MRDPRAHANWGKLSPSYRRMVERRLRPDFIAQLQLLTRRVASARVIAQALRQKEGPMTPKLQGLKDRLKDVTAKIEGRATRLTERLDRADEASATADARIHAELDKIERAVADVEGLVSSLSNGGPPLDDSSPSGGA